MAVYNYNASSSTNIDQNLIDFEGNQDANQFSIYVPTLTTYNPATNTTSVTYSYMLHARLNNFSQYSCTTYAQYKTNGAAGYTKSYNPATTIQYYAATTNRYYWMGNNDGTPPIAFTSIPTTGTVTSPASSAWSFTVNHDASGGAPATTIQAYMDSNTNTSYVPAATTITATLTANLTSPTTNLNYATPTWSSGISITSVSRRSGNPSIIDIVFAAGAKINTNINNTVYYDYGYSFDNVNWTNSSAQTVSAGNSAPTVTLSPSVNAAQNYSTIYLRVRASAASAMTTIINTSSTTGSSAGVPSVATSVSATEDSAQSRDVTISWTPGQDNGSAITLQTLAWSTDSSLSTGVTVQTFADNTTGSYNILNNRSTGKLLPNTTYYYKLTMSNSVGDNGTSIFSFTTRSSTPKVVPTGGTVPTTRSILKVRNGSGFVPAQARVFDGTNWIYLK